jgi:PBP1b-binding outer membrane lipoprotein LpoB
MRIKTSLVAPVAALLLVLAGCSGDDDTETTDTTQEQTDDGEEETDGGEEETDGTEEDAEEEDS